MSRDSFVISVSGAIGEKGTITKVTGVTVKSEVTRMIGATGGAVMTKSYSS